MLFLISPAKTLDYESPLPAVAATEPLFVGQSVKLIAALRKHKPAQIAELMDLSPALASLNAARYKAWRRVVPHAARPAALAFDGDVYGGLQARTLKSEQLAWAQDHLCILSGLYGVLRPLDRMQPYRLEMGTRLATERGSNLYQFWGSRIADHLNQQLAGDAAPVVVNLASQEYFKAVDTRVLKAPVLDCVFEELRAGQYQVISFMAKRARGLMARYAITHRVTRTRQLEGFAVEGYRYDSAASRPLRLVFRRDNNPTQPTI